MLQPTRKKITPKNNNTKIIKANKERKHQEYGTSKLEERFAKNFLDKLGIKYTYQYKAESIGRYYDFKLEDNILIEIDGDFYHGYNLVHEDKNKMQKHNEYVDRIKDRWALEHGFVLYRIWEHDINNNPQKVLDLLNEILYKKNLKNKKNKRH